MKVVKYNDRLQLRIDHDLKIKAEKIIAEKYKMSLSEYIRERIEEVTKNGN